MIIHWGVYSGPARGEQLTASAYVSQYVTAVRAAGLRVGLYYSPPS